MAKTTKQEKNTKQECNAVIQGLFFYCNQVIEQTGVAAQVT